MQAIQIGPVTQIAEVTSHYYSRHGAKEVNLKFVNQVNEQHSKDQNLRQLTMKTFDPVDAITEQPDNKKFISVQMCAEELFTQLSQKLVSNSQISKPQLDEKYFKLYYTVQQKTFFEPSEDYDFSYKLFTPNAFKFAEN